MLPEGFLTPYGRVSPVTMRIARQRAAKGAKLLDGRRKAWWRKIDTDTLDLGSCGDCILGQLYGDFGRGMRLLKLNSSYDDNDDDEKFGFYLSGRSGALKQAWMEEIQKQADEQSKRQIRNDKNAPPSGPTDGANQPPRRDDRRDKKKKKRK